MFSELHILLPAKSVPFRGVFESFVYYKIFSFFRIRLCFVNPVLRCALLCLLAAFSLQLAHSYMYCCCGNYVMSTLRAFPRSKINCILQKSAIIEYRMGLKGMAIIIISSDKCSAKKKCTLGLRWHHSFFLGLVIKWVQKALNPFDSKPTNYMTTLNIENNISIYREKCIIFYRSLSNFTVILYK